MFKVMVVDSEKYFLRSISQEFKKDYALLTCDQGAKAFPLYQIFSPDAVVLDPMTPGFGPGNFIARMKALSPKPWMPIVVASYAALIRQVEESYDWGADYYFFKPVVPARIHSKMRELLSRDSHPVNLQNLFSGKKGLI